MIRRSGSNEELLQFLQATDFIQSDSPVLQSALNVIINENDSIADKLESISIWIMDNLEYGSGQQDALSVYNNRVTDCGGYAALFVAFSRIIGIPARTVAGITAIDGKELKSGIWKHGQEDFGTHIWIELYFEKIGWMQIESTPFELEEITIEGLSSISEERVILSKSSVQIGETIASWFHIPWAGEHLDDGVQAEMYPYEFHMDVRPIEETE